MNTEAVIGRPRRAGEIIGRLVIGDEIPEADRPLDREWLRDRLIAANLAGGRAAVHRSVQHCLGWLLLNCIRTRQVFEQFLAHEGVQDELRDAYRTVLRRKQAVARDIMAGADVVDPVGLCQWGGLLWQAAGGGREQLQAAAAALRVLLVDYPEALDALKREHGVDRDGRNVVDQAAAHLGADKAALVEKLVAVVSRPKRRRPKSSPKPRATRKR